STAGSKPSNTVIDLGRYMAMPQSESNLGGARFIPPLKRRGFSVPAPDDPKPGYTSILPE
ncbi:MAG: hypothetical protein PHW87_08380, partial [Methanothrix sp.]|nr:hypothetical protein [Methanothrix sp.]